MAAKTPPLLLLPQPQEVRLLAGSLRLAGRVAISLPRGAERQDLTAARQLASDLGQLGVEAAVVRRAAEGGAAPQGGVAIRRGKARGGDEAYELNIRPKGIDVVAPSARGAYYAVQTLRQLVRQFGLRLPALAIRDWPDFKLRGVYHDISRGRVPTAETLKYLIELLAHLKVNALSLYVEYPFRYERHPQVWEDTRPLTADEILDLGAFAADHGVDFIPSQASFGHLERLLSKPPYRRLANTPARTFEATREFGREGTSLDPTNPASERLLTELYEEFLPQFDSQYFNACCDEVWDLGLGRSARRATRVGKGRLFADFIRRIHRLARGHGKRLMIWADILKHHPDAIAHVPKDTIMLNWWYYDRNIEEWMVGHSRAIRRSGHDLVVCPGVNNWGAFMPRTQQMRDNIRLFAEAGLRFKALGLLNTEWGDGGHYNLLATALPGFATGAEHSWAHARADDASIGGRWPLHVLGDRRREAERIVTLADYGKGEYRQTFTGFGDERKLDFDALATTPAKLLARQERFGARLDKAVGAACSLSNRLLSGPADPMWGFRPMDAALEYAVLTALALAKNQAVRGQLHKLLGRAAESRRLFRQAADATDDLLPDYRELWLSRNHESELDWSVRRFQGCIRRWHRAAKG